MLYVLDYNQDELLLLLPPAQLTYMARVLIEASRMRSHLLNWTRPEEVWREFFGAAQKVLQKKRASKLVRHFAEAVSKAPDDVRSHVLLAVGSAEDAYAYWALRAALACQEQFFGPLPPPALAVDAELADGRTPLNDALGGGDFGTAAYVLDHGADPERADGDACTPLMMAASYNIEGDDTGMPRQEAALPLVRRLLTRTTKVDRKDDLGATALTKAVRYGFADAARLLLAAGADPTAGLPGHRAIDLVANVAQHTDLVAVLTAARNRRGK